MRNLVGRNLRREPCVLSVTQQRRTGCAIAPPVVLIAVATWLAPGVAGVFLEDSQWDVV